MSLSGTLQQLLERLPLPLDGPWGAGWETEIAVTLEDGPSLVFSADGARLDVREGDGEDPCCRLRCDTGQLVRLLRGASAIIVLFEGAEVNRLAELIALQRVFVPCHGSPRAADR